MSCKLRLLFKSSLAMSPIFRELRQSRSTSKDLSRLQTIYIFFKKQNLLKNRKRKTRMCYIKKILLLLYRNEAFSTANPTRIIYATLRSDRST